MTRFRKLAGFFRITVRWLRASWRYREWPWRVPWMVGVVRKPTPEQAERALRIARERGWLTDDGFVWETVPSEEGEQ